MNRKVKALMVLRGVKSIDIAKQTGVSPTWVSLVLNGHKKSKRIRQAIAASLGVRYENLWPNNHKQKKRG